MQPEKCIAGCKRNAQKRINQQSLSISYPKLPINCQSTSLLFRFKKYMLMLPMWSLADGMNTTPLWMTVYYTITYALIYLALILCLYSGGEYLVNTFGGRKKTAKSEKETK